MSHIRMSHVTHIDESHMNVRVSHTNNSSLRNEWVTSHIYDESHMNVSVSHTNNSSLRNEWVTSHTWTSHVTHERVFHTHERVTSRTYMIDTALYNEVVTVRIPLRQRWRHYPILHMWMIRVTYSCHLYVMHVAHACHSYVCHKDMIQVTHMNEPCLTHTNQSWTWMKSCHTHLLVISHICVKWSILVSDHDKGMSWNE